MFGNRGFGWKLAVALSLVAGVGVLSWSRSRWINPSLWRCMAEPERAQRELRGEPLWIPRAAVLSAGADTFTIEAGEIRIPVHGAPPAGVGSLVELRARFHARGPHLELVAGRALRPHARLRWLSEAVSIAVLGLVLLNVRRHFTVRPKALQVEGV